MDLLNRRTSTTSRRGTLLPGGARRNGSGAQANADTKNASHASAKTKLLDEFRAHEENEAARVLQRAARAFLSRKFVARLLQQVYRRQYDPIEKQYYYINIVTNETTWEKPRALRMFLSETQDVPVSKARGDGELPVSEASRRIQRAGRAFLARKLLQRLVRENYMKLFDTSSKTFYYLNTRTGERSPDRPIFLGKDDANDIPVETFQFRKAVCKVSSSSNLYGSGVVGFFGAASDSTQWLCLLGDAKTLPDAATASTAHVVCNYCQDATTTPFQITLRPERFFTTISVETNVPQFALCAVDRETFVERAGRNIEPLRLEMNDRKLGCANATAGGVQLHDVIEIVGHPHGKPRVLHTRKLAKMLPNSIAPLRLQYDREMESGAAGCAVYTRGGKLLGLQHFTPLKELPPREFYYIRPILDVARALVTPPEPFLLTTCLSSHDVYVCWSTVRWFKPLPGLAIEFELEICRPEATTTTTVARTRSYDKFECVYRGPHKSKHIGNLHSECLYSLRVRACNPLVKSGWSHVLKFRTLPTPSLAWRIPRYCTSIRDACARMRQQQHDGTAQFHGVQWIARYLDQHAQELTTAEMEFVDAHALDWVLETITTRFPDHQPLVLFSLRVLTTLSRLHARVQRLLSRVPQMETVIDLLRRFLPEPVQGTLSRIPPDQSIQTDIDGRQKKTARLEATTDDAMAISRTCVELLGAVLDGDNASAQQTAQALALVPTLLAVLSAHDNHLLREHTPFVAECVFLFARYTHHHTLSGKWQLVANGRLAVLRDILVVYAETSASSIVYWTLLTLGNIAYASIEPTARHHLEQETRTYQLLGAIGHARTQFLLRRHELELAQRVAQREFSRLAASVMGDEMRNEMDAYDHDVQILGHAIQDLNDHGDVAAAADFALRYLLSAEQHRVQAVAKRLVTTFLHRTLAAAFGQWREATEFHRHYAVVRAFVTTVRHCQLSAAFRKWEAFLREWRRLHKSVVVDAVLGAGLAIDLNKRHKERYRILALQK